MYSEGTATPDLNGRASEDASPRRGSLHWIFVFELVHCVLMDEWEFVKFRRKDITFQVELILCPVMKEWNDMPTSGNFKWFNEETMNLCKLKEEYHFIHERKKHRVKCTLSNLPLKRSLFLIKKTNKNFYHYVWQWMVTRLIVIISQYIQI